MNKQQVLVVEDERDIVQVLEFALILAFGPISGAHFNPAVTLARAATDTFAGIHPADAPGFIAAPLAGAALATALFRRLAPPLPAKDIVVPHS